MRPAMDSDERRTLRSKIRELRRKLRTANALKAEATRDIAAIRILNDKLRNENETLKHELKYARAPEYWSMT